ncbi:hypothetical protein BVY04_01995 [bacterium M21]|nr:hypothetical protein BVY04_01995 [bacterium M21]
MGQGIFYGTNLSGGVAPESELIYFVGMSSVWGRWTLGTETHGGCNMPRQKRDKITEKGRYYLLTNRLATENDNYPLTDKDKAQIFRLFVDISDFFLIEIISLAVLGDHFHCLCYAPGEAPDIEQAAARYNEYYQSRKPPLRSKRQKKRCQEVANSMINISDFMARFQQRFACYYNRTHARHGSLWADRFKSTIIEDGAPMWHCVKYLSLNPVRAKITEDPAEYPFSSWGGVNGTNKDPFEESLTTHMRKNSPRRAGQDLTYAAIYRLLCREYERLKKSEAKISQEELKARYRQALNGEAVRMTFLYRTRCWKEGGRVTTLKAGGAQWSLGTNEGDRLQSIKVRV